MKIMTVKREQIRRGDFVLQDNGAQGYLVTEVGRTSFKNYPYLKVVYANGEKRRWILYDLSEKKTICRVTQ